MSSAQAPYQDKKIKRARAIALCKGPRGGSLTCGVPGRGGWGCRSLLSDPRPWPPARQVEAIEYYTKLEQKLKEDYKREKEKVNEKPLGMAFVTFHNETITAM